MDTKGRKKVVVIGGGTGTFNLLQGLKDYSDQIYITKIVSMADNGGSNARIRDEFGYLPLSDANRSLVALATNIYEHDQLLRELFLYRFNKGEGLAGHNFGNLLLIALADLLGSESEAIKMAAKILSTHGQVLPVTTESVHLVATYNDGSVVVGEHEIDEPPVDRKNSRIVKLETDCKAAVTKEASQAIREADLLIVGPGDFYTSLLASCVIDGVPEAINDCAGKFCYISNLMTRPGQTRGMYLSEYIKELEIYLGRTPESVLVNTTVLPSDILNRYKSEGDLPVSDDLGETPIVIRKDFLATETVNKKAGDTLTRSLIRHDGVKLAKTLLSLIE